MIIKVTYNKNTGDITLNGDINIISLNINSIQDTTQELLFEIALDTTYYEQANNIEGSIEENIEEIE